jgi:2-C-methyl-D-erythritol 2,4-cyclodiphosphate synthase
MKIRVGFGYDVHRLVDGHPFVLGGVKINHEKGAFGHSDADVLLHVICDALLGAANLRDIGFNFPDTDDKYKGIDSKILLKESYQLVREKGYALSNLDCTICLQRPKINPLIPEMKEGIASLLSIDIDDVSIKATTTEKLGFVGREDGISAYCTCLIHSV